MFEVGKKYTNPRTRDMATVLYADAYGAYLHWEQEGRRFHMSQTDFKTGEYKEHKEPRTITRWVNVYEDVKNTYLSFGNMWEDKDCAIRHGKGCDKTYMVYVDTIPISYTEPH